MRDPKIRTFSFRLSAEDYLLIETAAELEDMSASNFVRKAAKERARKVCAESESD